MKKLLLTLIAVLYLTTVHAQNYQYENVTEIENLAELRLCTPEYDGIVISKDPTCNSWIAWTITSYSSGDYWDYDTDNVTITPSMGTWLRVQYQDNCQIHWKEFYIRFSEFQLTEPWPQEFTWKRTGTNVTLEAPYGDDLQYQWSNGSHQRTITVTQPGTYWVRIYNDCGELYDTIQVRDNAEITLATCDLETNHNLVIWPTTPAQAEYVDQVQIKRDGMVVGTADYSAGSFIDNIGSDAASRTYTITAIGTDGVPCPIESYPKETIHMAYLTGINNTIEVNWNAPTGYDLMGFNICEWHEDDGSLTVIDFVGASVTSYTCSESQFDEGYIVVQGVEAGKDSETRLLSNRSMDLVGLGENEATAFKVYPNPANNVLFVETVCTPSLPVETYRITNPIGQTVMQGEITSEKHQINVRNLPNGVYFITVDGATRKFVVE